MNVLFKNFKLVDGGVIKENTDLLVEGDKISHMRAGLPDSVKVFDGENKLYLSAGFIDIHVHGGGGFDFMDAIPEEYMEITAMHARHGTTSMYATTVSASQEELTASVNAFAAAKSKRVGAKLLGLHLEGPYLAMSQKGAMDARYIRDPIPEEYEKLCGMSADIKRITLAPELKGAVELCAYLKERGIIASIGHTDAVAADVIRAYNEGGARLMTHLYSAMSMTRRIGINRFAGAVEAAYLLDDMYTEAICDGIHLPAELLKLIYKLKGDERMILITDAMRAAGMPEGGTAILGSRRANNYALIEDGVAKLPDRTAFAGSIATTDRLVRTAVKSADIPLASAVKMATSTPARAMGIFGERGSIEEGKLADLIVFDDDIGVKLTMVEGNICHCEF